MTLSGLKMSRVRVNKLNLCCLITRLSQLLRYINCLLTYFFVCFQCKNVTALKMKAEVDQAAVRLLFLLDYAIFPGSVSFSSNSPTFISCPFILCCKLCRGGRCHWM